DLDRGAKALAAGVAEFERGAGALKQRLGDEEPEPEAASGGAGVTLRHIGFADAVQYLRGEARAVVDDRQPHRFRIPAPVQRHRLAREIDAVLDEVAEPVDDARIAPSDRFRPLGPALVEADRDAEIAMRRHHVLDERGE